MTNKPQRRRRLFQRSTSDVVRTSTARQDHAHRGRQAEITSRDLDIVALIAQHRFLDAAQVTRVFACRCPRVEKPGIRAGKATTIKVKAHRPNCSCSCGVGDGRGPHAPHCRNLFKDDQHVTSRLLELYHAGLLDRPVVQMQLRIRNGVRMNGSLPLIYSVSAAGLRAIGEERRNALSAGKLSWVGRIETGTQTFLEHTLDIAGVSIGIDVALRVLPHLRRVDDKALRAALPGNRSTSPQPFALRSSVGGVMLSAVPDLAFAVETTATSKRFHYLVEVDRGTEPVERKTLRQTSILRKLLAYGKAEADGLIQHELGWRGCRVVILTTSPERARNCAAMARRRLTGSPVLNLFLFGCLDDTADILTTPLDTADGRTTTLIDDINRTTTARM